MGILDGLIGNASKLDSATVQSEFANFLISSEKVEHAYVLVRDKIIFTNKRLIVVDVQGITGKKIEYKSVPYSKITHFSIETAGSFDLDAELKVWVSGLNSPIELKFNKKVSIYEVEKILAESIL